MHDQTQANQGARASAAEWQSRSAVDPETAPDCFVPDLTSLIRAVESDVIPNLLIAYRRTASGTRGPTESEVVELADLVLAENVSGAIALVEGLIQDGVGTEAVYVDLLGATARQLGRRWEEDRIGFFEVTVGLCALHQILFRIAPRIDRDNVPERVGRKALFVPTPGERHYFGALIAAKVFARAGWQVWTEVAIEHDRLLDLVAGERFQVVGLSLSALRHEATLAATIADMRRVTAGRTPFILVGGNAVHEDEHLGAHVGADGAATDAPTGLRLAETFVETP